MLQTRALYVGGALLKVQPAATLSQLSAADSPGEKINTELKKFKKSFI